MQQCGGRLELADAETALPQGGGRLAAPLVEQQVDPVQELVGRTRGGLVDEAGRAAVRHQLGRLVHRLRRRTASAHGDADLAGDPEVAPVAGHEQPSGQELFHGGARRRRGHRTGGLVAGAVGPGLLEVLEHLPRGSVDVGREPGHPVRVGEHLRHEAHVGGAVAGRALAQVGEQARDPVGPGRGQQLVDRGTEAADRRAQGVAEGTDCVQVVVGPPQQRSRAQRADGGPGQLGLRVDDRHQRVGVDASAEGNGSVRDSELEPVEVVEGAEHRGPGRGARREL